MSAFTNRSKQSGFTLLEVLVAFVLFAMSFAVVMQILTSSVRNTARSQEYTQAALWAQSVMAEVGIAEPVETVSQSGSFNDKYSYSLDISEYDMSIGEGLASETIPVELYLVAVEIYWGDSNNRASARFSTLKALNGNLR